MKKSKLIGSTIILGALVAGTAYLLTSANVPPLPRTVTAIANDPAPVGFDAVACRSMEGGYLAYGTAMVQAAALADNTSSGTADCVVTVAFTASDLKFQARLPLGRWNQRMVYIGGGGFDGLMTDVPDYVSPSIKAKPYVTVMTNGGHDAPLPTSYFDAEFALDGQKLVDFTYLSEHRSLPVAKELIENVYGTSPARSYFEGCSMGGHDALMEAQRFPYDFDGIIARAPAGNIMGLFAKFHQISQQVEAVGALSDTQREALSVAVLQACDTLDGAKDGIVSNLKACKVDVKALACPAAGGGENCLSAKQVALVEIITSEFRSEKTGIHHGGYPVAGAAETKAWGEYIWPQLMLGNTSLQGAFSTGFIRSFITRDADYDVEAWQVDDWKAPLGQVSSLFQAYDPDLSRLADYGGKLIVWNGVSDTSVSANDTVGYYEAVRKSLGEATAEETVALFLSPGVGHCRGGAGADKSELMDSLVKWVEDNRKPTRQDVTAEKHADDGTVIMTAPLCKYPSYPHYRGSGDMNSAENFDCRT
ncbi:tannase/feruloyl esterase family alpha/beta hydrolase [Kordiimonas aestuarii]|uniref:tannase/feruloyl esterase family alpha/beta hydrolase n=1 Tax=Kordiimonas aestuarii TaxID=1005925 RepID=UPI0021D2D59B|nr:tannase/feruloyl esterase family alpha/beta hydrolase [Kordiimonas aestuarii]